ncbi:MAG: GNAT family N-acetyltransferase [Coriobacteriia bacterium]
MNESAERLLKRKDVRQTGGAYVEVVIREASVDDAQSLLDYAARLFAECLPGLWRRQLPSLDEERSFIASYDASNSTLVLAESDGRTVALAGLLGKSLEQESHVGVIGVSVDRDYRGQGIGTQLLEHLIAWAPAHGISRIEIEAFANNPGAIALYERLGFEREGVRKAAVVVDEKYVDIIGLALRPVA